MNFSHALRAARPAVPKSVLIAGAAAALAMTNHLLAKRSERRHPPRGQVIDVNGVAVHYFEAGAGTPVVLIHGNGVTAEDWVVSGLFHRLAASHRVIAFDRPGFGYTPRPRGRIWTASAQAKLLAGALDQLGVESPTVVAHSWGTLVALRLALLRPDLVSGLGLMSGYYFATPRLDVPMLSGPAIPLLGDVMRYTLSPILGRLLAPLIFRQVFSPARVTPAFKAQFPTSLTLRPGQVRASAGDTALMLVEARNVSKHYRDLSCPVLLIAGDGDKVASFKRQSAKLASEIGVKLEIVAGAGHMVHHTAPDAVELALEGLLARTEGFRSVAAPAHASSAFEGAGS